jgi:hypothetical protein
MRTILYLAFSISHFAFRIIVFNIYILYMMDFLSDCTPAKLHAILTIFTLTGTFFAGLPLFQMLKSIIASAVWLFLLNWLCSKGFTWLSWFLVLFPFIVLIGALIAFIFIATKIEPQKKTNAQTEQTQ